MRYKAALVAQNIMAVMDEDKDGYITVREWTEWSLRQLGETKARRRRKAKSDANIENFLRALETTIATERKRLLLAVISQLFLKYDQNSDGHVDETDVAKMIVDLKSNSVDESHRNDVSHASEDAKSIVTSFDRDGNGMVELDEWVYFVGEGISRSAARGRN